VAKNTDDIKPCQSLRREAILSGRLTVSLFVVLQVDSLADSVVNGGGGAIAARKAVSSTLSRATNCPARRDGLSS